MRLAIQRSVDAVPYRAAYVRLAGTETEPARCSLVLPPDDAGEEDREVLARMLGLVIALGEGPGGAPIRQHWLGEDGRIEGKLGSDLAARHAAEADRLAGRIGAEWDRFLGNALARLRGEARGDAHFRFAGREGEGERPVVWVTAWPPLAGEPLPVLE